MSNKSLYKELCEVEDSIPIFSRPWWMDAVCGEDNWDVIIVYKGGEICATLPYYFNKKRKGLIISEPTLTQKNGIWIRYPKNQKLSSRYSYERKITNEVIENLEALDLISYNQNFHYEFQNWLPFYWKGFKQNTRYTYLIDELDNLDMVFSNIETKTKNQIRKAEKILEIKEDLSIEEFYKLNDMSFKRQNMNIPYSFEFLKRLDDACLKNNCRKILYAQDELGRKHATVYIVWDENSAYYLMGGADPELRKSNATSLLIWEAIKISSNVTKSFDFEGSMIESIEKLFSAFGAKQTQYFNIHKTYKITKLWKDIATNIYDSSVWIQKNYKKIRGR